MESPSTSQRPHALVAFAGSLIVLAGLVALTVLGGSRTGTETGAGSGDLVVELPLASAVSLPGSVEAAVESIFSAPEFLLDISRGEEWWTLFDEGRLAAVRTLISSHLGSDLSLRYDILPLLRGQTTIETSRRTDGSLIFSIHGRHADNLDRILPHLKESLSSKSHEARVVTHSAEDKLSMRVIESGAESSTRESIINGWSVWVTGDDEHGTILAWQGSAFIVSDAPKAVEKFLRSHEGALNADLTADLTDDSMRLQYPVSSFWSARQLRAGGIADVATLRTLLATLPLESPPVLPELSGRVLWSLQQSGNTVTLTLEQL
jgi:hypothetical protein